MPARTFYAKIIWKIDRRQFCNIRKQIKIVWHFFFSAGRHRNRILQIARFFFNCRFINIPFENSTKKKREYIGQCELLLLPGKITAPLPTTYFSFVRFFSFFLLPHPERLLMFKMVIFRHFDCNPMRSATCTSVRVTRTGSNDIEKSTRHFHSTMYSVSGERTSTCIGRTNKQKNASKLNAIIYYLLASAFRMG